MRFICIVVALVMVVSIFAACEKKNDKPVSEDISSEASDPVSSVVSDPVSSDIDEPGEVAGGWTLPEEFEPAHIEKVALETFEKSYDIEGVSLEPVALLGGQIVSGENYALLVRSTPVIPNGKPHYAVEIIYCNTSGECEITSIEDFNLSINDESSDMETGVPGGWSYAKQEEGKLPEDVKEAFDKAIEELEGCAYTPVAYLGSQVVAGINYAVLTEITPLNSEEGKLAVMYILCDLQGNTEVVISPVNITAYIPANED